MTEIDDSEALDAATAAALKLGNGTIGCQVGFEAALRAYASNLRQQLAEANAKLERLEKAARDVLWQQKHGTEGSQWGAFDRMSRALLVPLPPALSTQEPAGAAGVVPSELPAEVRQLLESLDAAAREVAVAGPSVAGRAAALIRKLLAQHRPAKGPAWTMETADRLLAAYYKQTGQAALGVRLEGLHQAGLAIGLGQPPEPKGAGLVVSAAAYDESQQTITQLSQQLYSARADREKAGRELAECREELERCGKACAEAKRKADDHRRLRDEAQQLLENRTRDYAAARDARNDMLRRAEAAESALAVERETVERLRRELRAAKAIFDGGDESEGEVFLPAAIQLQIDTKLSEHERAEAAEARLRDVSALSDILRARLAANPANNISAEAAVRSIADEIEHVLRIARIQAQPSAEPRPKLAVDLPAPKKLTPEEMEAATAEARAARTAPKPGDVVDNRPSDAGLNKRVANIENWIAKRDATFLPAGGSNG